MLSNIFLGWGVTWGHFLFITGTATQFGQSSFVLYYLKCFVDTNSLILTLLPYFLKVVKPDHCVNFSYNSSDANFHIITSLIGINFKSHSNDLAIKKIEISLCIF